MTIEEADDNANNNEEYVDILGFTVQEMIASVIDNGSLASDFASFLAGDNNVDAFDGEVAGEKNNHSLSHQVIRSRPVTSQAAAVICKCCDVHKAYTDKIKIQTADYARQGGIQMLS
jgi:hypothetical protein